MTTLNRCIVELDPFAVVMSAQQTHNIPPAIVSMGRGAHAVSRVLSGALGGHAVLKPWRLMPGFKDGLAVTGWGSKAEIEAANLTAAPDEIGCVKAVHDAGSVTFRDGGDYFFDVLVCPLYRPGLNGKVFRDVALRGVAQDQKVTFEDRARAYKEWLQGKLEGTAEIRVCHLKNWSYSQYPGKNHPDGGWRYGNVRYPQVHMQGRLIARDAAAFAGIVRAGIGRQKSEGMGDMHLKEAI